MIKNLMQPRTKMVTEETFSKSKGNVNINSNRSRFPHDQNQTRYENTDIHSHKPV